MKQYRVIIVDPCSADLFRMDEKVEAETPNAVAVEYGWEPSLLQYNHEQRFWFVNGDDEEGFGDTASMIFFEEQ